MKCLLWIIKPSLVWIRNTILEGDTKTRSEIMDFVSDLRDATLDAASAIGFAAKEVE